jgi:hypothetical protein
MRRGIMLAAIIAAFVVCLLRPPFMRNLILLESY